MGEQSGMPGFGRTEEDFSRVDVRRLVQALLAVLPAAHVLHDSDDLRLGVRKHHDQRQLAEGCHAVTLIGAQVFRVVEHVGRWQHPQQSLHQAPHVHPGEILLCPAETGHTRLLTHHGVSLSIS
ncbi:MAG: hypothetical protein E6R15_07090, partial [Zoogloea sp.]